MPRSLSGRLALVLCSALCAVVVAFGVLAYRGTQSHLDEANQKLNRDLARYLVETNKLAKGDPVNRRALSTLFANLMSVNPNIEIYLLDADGTILSYSAAEQRVKRKAVDLGPLKSFLAGEKPFPLPGDDPRHPERRKVFSVAPLPATGPTEAYLYVVLGGEDHDSVADMLQQSRLTRTTLQIAALAIGFLALTWLVLFWSVTHRLHELNRRVSRFREGETSAPHDAARIGDGDEIDQLGATFDAMAARIVEQVEALKQTDALRRELIANVSHDLRTPLTALHGYIETLLMKGDSLTAAQRREHLETAERSSQRLSRLVSELFELAKLESSVEPPKREAFSATDLLQDVAAEFQVIAESRGVHLATEVDGVLPAVAGDIELIERALQNLIQNAIQHTPADGHVVLGAVLDDTDGGGVMISVRDTGRGIAADDLPHIFDRFYRARAGADAAGGAGLGLAIAKRVMELHGRTIRAASEIGVGTTFAFSLPAAAKPAGRLGLRQDAPTSP